MSLFLAEVSLSQVPEEKLQDGLVEIEKQLENRGRLIEVQIGTDVDRAYIIAQVASEKQLEEAFKAAGYPVVHIKEVLLVGADPDDVKGNQGDTNYLVEWHLPSGLTMEQYLARKKEKSPLYAQVPEVRFERTYVATDMSKCLCLYDSPDEKAVKKAREVVEAPVDTLTKVKAVKR